MDSFRCIHASRLLLDHQLHAHQLDWGQSSVAELAPDVRKIIEDATLIAFEQVVEQALAHDVHCVLISGDSFDPDDCGLRGPAALVRGIGRLTEHDIPVLLQAGRPGLWSSWPAGLRWPANAHRLGPGLTTSVSITREGRLRATVAVGDPTQHSSANLPAGHSGWQIHLPAVHPTGASATAETIHLHDDCGPTQGLCADERGPHGFTLIEIGATSEPHHTFVPAAPVRWEEYSIEVSAVTSRDDLLQDMASRLEQTTRQTCEKVWLVAWDVTGRGPLFERLLDCTFRDELLEELTGLDPVRGVQIHTHALRLHPVASAWPPNAENGPALEQNGAISTGLETNLAAEFAMRLEQRLADPEQAIESCLPGSALVGGPWQVEIESLIAELDAGEVAHDARRLAMHWFAAQEELSS